MTNGDRLTLPHTYEDYDCALRGFESLDRAACEALAATEGSSFTITSAYASRRPGCGRWYGAHGGNTGWNYQFNEASTTVSCDQHHQCICTPTANTICCTPL